MTLDNITREEFDTRLDAANDRLRQELNDTQERVRRLDELIHRKEIFSQKLDEILTEIDEAEVHDTRPAVADRKYKEGARCPLNR